MIATTQKLIQLSNALVLMQNETDRTFCIGKIRACANGDDKEYCRVLESELAYKGLMLQEKAREASILDDIVRNLRKELYAERVYSERLEKEVYHIIKK